MDMTIADCETGEISVTPLTEGQRASLAEAAAQDEAERTQRQAEADQRRADAEALLGALPKEARDAAKRLLRL